MSKSKQQYVAKNILDLLLCHILELIQIFK